MNLFSSFLNKFLADLRFHIDENNLSMRAELLRTRLRMYPTMILSQFLIEPVFVWLLWGNPSISHSNLLLWLVSFYSLHLVELIYWLKLRHKTHTIPNCRKWSQLFFVFALAAGFMWGMGTLLFFPHQLLAQVLIVCITLGLAAGAVTTNSTHLPALYAYLISLMLPLILRLMQENSEAHLALGFLLILFLIVILISGHFLYRIVFQSLLRRFENQLLAQQLVAMNDELEQRVDDRTLQLSRKSEEVALIRDVTILAMGTLAETRDNETGNHIKRTQHYIPALAVSL
ncbi:MAG: phosphohydrolase, partial [Gallionellaceae bacterium]